MKQLRFRSSFGRCNRQAWLAGFLVGSLLLIVPARAQEAAQPVTLKEALDLFAQHNLALRVLQAEAAAQAGLAHQAAAYSNPSAISRDLLCNSVVL